MRLTQDDTLICMTLISYMWVEVQQIYEQNLKIIAMIHETITLH